MIKKVAITFDDGPNPPFTNQILDILKKENIKATFFVCGANIKRHPQVVSQIAQQNHTIGNHTYNHSYKSTFLGTIYKETLETQKLIESIAPQPQKLFRSPYFKAAPWVKNKLEKTGFKIYGGIVGNDWEENTTPQKISQNILSKVKDDTIIVLHDGFDIKEGADRSKTVVALKLIIEDLKRQNYQFVGLSEIKNPQNSFFAHH